MEDYKTNVKIEEQDFQEEYIEIEKRIPNKSNQVTQQKNLKTHIQFVPEKKQQIFLQSM